MVPSRLQTIVHAAWDGIIGEHPVATDDDADAPHVVREGSDDPSERGLIAGSG